MIRSFTRNNQILVKVKGRPSFGKAAATALSQASCGPRPLHLTKDDVSFESGLAAWFANSSAALTAGAFQICCCPAGRTLRIKVLLHTGNRQWTPFKPGVKVARQFLGAQETTFGDCGVPDESIAFTSSDRAAVPP
jgi:hypothetical protein